MPRLSKRALLEHVEEGIQAGGWNILYLTNSGEHPARYRVERDGNFTSVKVYIWNITHGGGYRSASEFRIQITGIEPNQFIPEKGGKTLILGFWEAEEVFAGFDFKFHAGPLGGSPSLQIGAQALVDANQYRFAAHEKGNGELAIAFTPDFMGTYIENLTSLHATGQVPAELDLLTRLAEDPTAVPETEIDATVSEVRQYAIVQTKRALRALDFRNRVLTAYGHRCAMCGVQLRLVEGAHILPVSEAGSTDKTSNGIALCIMHHRAYDRGLVTFDQQYQIHVSSRQIAELQLSAHDGGISQFAGQLRQVVHLPPAASDRPLKPYIKKANALRGWELL
jgi:putative restriction endonuclease